MFDRFRKEKNSGESGVVARSSRHSRGWADILKHMKATEGLRVLDFGATSAVNINYLTTLGHSVYMANIVQDATRPEWRKAPAADAKPGAEPEFDTAGFAEPEFDTAGFVAANLDFTGRDFDVVLLWDTANYLPPPLVPALFERLLQVLRPDGRLLAFFHGRSGSDTFFSRYQLGDGDDLVVLSSGNFPVQTIYQTRQIEKFLQGYTDIRFFLGKDNVREVTASRQ